MAEKKGDPVIVVEGLTARYSNRTILENVSFKVYRGERFVVLGESGCGKSTLLKNIIGLLEVTKGKVEIFGTDITKHDPDSLKDLRRKMGVLFQSNALFTSMTLSENVSFPIRASKLHEKLSGESINMIVKMKLGMVGLAAAGNRYPSELSGGMQKRAGFARAIALDPEILFFDEPSAGLDPITGADVDNLIKGINSSMGTTIVIVTQELESIMNVSERVIMLHKDTKGIIAEGDPRELKEHSEDPRVSNFFNRRPMKKERGAWHKDRIPNSS